MGCSDTYPAAQGTTQGRLTPYAPKCIATAGSVVEGEGERARARVQARTQSNGTDQRARGIVVWGNAASYMLHHTCRGLQEWWRLTMNRFVSSFSVRIRSVLISFKIRFLSTFENPPMRTVFHATM